VFLEQDSIGWYNFLLGRVSTKFQEIQGQYYLQLQQRNTGARWLKLLIVKIWEVSWDMWEHHNHILHNTLTKRKQEELSKLQEEARAQIAIGTAGLLPQDYHWLRQPQRLFNKTSDQLQLWLHSIHLARAAWSNEQLHKERQFQATRRFMERWLATAHNPPDSPTAPS